MTFLGQVNSRRSQHDQGGVGAPPLSTDGGAQSNQPDPQSAPRSDSLLPVRFGQLDGWAWRAQREGAPRGSSATYGSTSASLSTTTYSLVRFTNPPLREASLPGAAAERGFDWE